MHTNSLLVSLVGGLALAQAQQVQVQSPLPPVLLTTTKSGVLPVIPTETAFTGVLLNEGAIITPGPPKPGFTGLGGTATAQSNIPVATYRAELPAVQFNPLAGTTIRGSIVAVGTSQGVQFTFNLTNLPSQASYGPFGYHIHTLPVPANGNCTETMGHLDPTNRGELYMCDPSAPQTCQVGDLAGKHGGKVMAANSWSTSYTDAYLSTDPSSPAFFGNLAFVFHTNNATRLTCANFVLMGDMGTNTTTPTVSGTGVPTSTATTPPFTGGAAGQSSVSGIMGAMVAAVGIAMLLL